MTPMIKTFAGLTGGWVAGRAFGLLARLQAGHGAASRPRRLQSRRAFTRNAALGGALIVLAEIGVGALYLVWPNKTGAFGGLINVAAGNVPEVNGSPFKVQDGKFFLVRTEDGVEALYWKCVHLGCTVPWIEGEQRFHCPCHGSIYLYDGTRESGPAPRALDRFPLTVGKDGSVSVDTNPTGVIKRDKYTPADAVPYNV